MSHGSVSSYNLVVVCKTIFVVIHIPAMANLQHSRLTHVSGRDACHRLPLLLNICSSQRRFQPSYRSAKGFATVTRNAVSGEHQTVQGTSPTSEMSKDNDNYTYKIRKVHLLGLVLASFALHANFI